MGRFLRHRLSFFLLRFFHILSVIGIRIVLLSIKMGIDQHPSNSVLFCLGILSSERLTRLHKVQQKRLRSIDILIIVLLQCISFVVRSLEMIQIRGTLVMVTLQRCTVLVEALILVV